MRPESPSAGVSVYRVCAEVPWRGARVPRLSVRGGDPEGPARRHHIRLLSVSPRPASSGDAPAAAAAAARLG